VLVMVTMVSGPPQRAFLRGGAPAKRHHQLHRAAHLVAAMPEVAVVAGGDEEHAPNVQRRGEGSLAPAEPRPDDADGGEMHEQERDRANPFDTLIRGTSVGAFHGRFFVARGRPSRCQESVSLDGRGPMARKPKACALPGRGPWFEGGGRMCVRCCSFFMCSPCSFSAFRGPASWPIRGAGNRTARSARSSCGHSGSARGGVPPAPRISKPSCGPW